jgi:DNA ligase-1
MELSRLVRQVERVRATARKTEKVALLAELLEEARGASAALAALYLSGTLPQGRIGVGGRTLRGAATDAPASGPPLGLEDVDRAMGALAAEQGAGSALRRREILGGLLARATPAERRFLAGLLFGEIRQGADAGLVQEAIAKAARLPSARVREAAMYAPHLGALAEAALTRGAAGLDGFSLQPLSPVAPMLASTADSVDDALSRLGEAAFEYKLDGARIQLHKAGDEVRVFTRQLQDATARVPEVVDWARALPVRTVVLEGEAIALRAGGRPHPFQVTMRRFSRSKDVEAARAELPLQSFFFDCLYADGDGPLVAQPYTERRRRLLDVVSEASRLPQIVTGRAEEAARFFEESLARGHEGLMAKSLAGPYAAGQRGFHWLKLKSARTLDLVVLAAEWGSGRREGWLSNLHLGARDEASGELVMLGKTFKGLTDAMLEWQTAALLRLEERRDEWTVYVRPELVVEIAFNDVQESPRYPAGLALRFARVKAHRPDKPARDADTLAAVRAIFEQQRA